MVVEIITDVYIPIKWSERRDDRKHPMCRSIGNGWREVTYVVSRYQMIRFMFRETGFFGNYIESQYYNHLGGKKAKNSSKGVRLVMGNICAICYSFQDVLSDHEIKRSRNAGGKNPLLI